MIWLYGLRAEIVLSRCVKEGERRQPRVDMVDDNELRLRVKGIVRPHSSTSREESISHPIPVVRAEQNYIQQRHALPISR